MKPFWEEVKSTKCRELNDLSKDVERIAALIESRVGRITGNEAVRTILRDVLPYHLVLAFNGSRDEAPMDTVEYAALALGEDIRVAVKGDNRGRRSA
jgi:hypothetical protein